MPLSFSAPRQGALRALIFDVDGTLADTEGEGHRVAFNLAFQEAGLDWHWDRVLYRDLLRVAGGKERIAWYMTRHRPAMPVAADALAAQLHAMKTVHYCALVDAGKVRLRPGVARLLREAREAGLALAVASTTTVVNIAALLDATLGQGASGWFDVIAAGDSVPHKKPAPDVYLHVLGVLGLSPGACFAFEDSGLGLAASSGAGIRTIVTPTAYTAGDDFARAFSVLSSLGEPHDLARHLGGCAPWPAWIGVSQLMAWSRMPVRV